MATAQKERLDQLLVASGLAPSRQKAQAYILAGQVLVDDVPVDKPGTKIPLTASIRIRGETSPFVGRGGEKLQGALEDFQIDVSGLIALDVGASTGGFTDCLLQRGAERVYAVDVGHNQLAHALRTNSRVIVMERTHVKDLHSSMFSPPPTIAVIDVSFIGLRKILEYVCSVLARPSLVIGLVKPQFELEQDAISKGGVVRSEEDQQRAVQSVRVAGEALGLCYQGVVPSKLRGQKKGNQEFFIYFKSR